MFRSKDAPKIQWVEARVGRESRLLEAQMYDRVVSSCRGQGHRRDIWTPLSRFGQARGRQANGVARWASRLVGRAS